MVGNVLVKTPEEFDEWQKSQIAEKAGTASAAEAAPPSEGRS